MTEHGGRAHEAHDPEGNGEGAVKVGGGAIRVSRHLSDRLYLGAP